MEYVVYILYSKSIDRYYVGYTGVGIDTRLKEHNSNHKGFTGGIGDWSVVHTESFQSKREAILHERFLKAKKSRRYLE
ncbi:MAG: GIY-YIG nuclease family protein [Flavobacteriaceae bacterium]|nr:GIY-YIG nuclease family protein [Flavobacteriaceae bacterium]